MHRGLQCPQLEAEDEVVTDAEAVTEGESPLAPREDSVPPMPRMMSTGEISSGLLCSTSTTSPMERPGVEITLQTTSGSWRVVKLQSWTTMRSSKK
jgi:hypothetical protein